MLMEDLFTIRGTTDEVVLYKIFKKNINNLEVLRELASRNYVPLNIAKEMIELNSYYVLTDLFLNHSAKLSHLKHEIFKKIKDKAILSDVYVLTNYILHLHPENKDIVNEVLDWAIDLKNERAIYCIAKTCTDPNRLSYIFETFGCNKNIYENLSINEHLPEEIQKQILFKNNVIDRNLALKSNSHDVINSLVESNKHVSIICDRRFDFSLELLKKILNLDMSYGVRLVGNLWLGFSLKAELIKLENKLIIDFIDQIKYSYFDFEGLIKLSEEVIFLSELLENDIDLDAINAKMLVPKIHFDKFPEENKRRIIRYIHLFNVQ